MPKYTMKFTIENTIRMLLPNRKPFIRPWSPIRCKMSPVMRESKNCKGIAVSLIKKSEINAISMREFMCSIIHERM